MPVLGPPVGLSYSLLFLRVVRRRLTLLPLGFRVTIFPPFAGLIAVLVALLVLRTDWVGRLIVVSSSMSMCNCCGSLLLRRVSVPDFVSSVFVLDSGDVSVVVTLLSVLAGGFLFVEVLPVEALTRG